MSDIINIPNFEDVSLFSNYTPPAADYLCEISDTPKVKNKEGKMSQIAVPLKIVAAKDQVNFAKEEGNVFTDYIPFGINPKTGKDASFRFKNLLVASGLIDEDDKTSEMARGQINLGVLKGQKAMVRVTHYMYTDPAGVKPPAEKYNVEYLIGG
jgi:hypothetical protein